MLLAIAGCSNISAFNPHVCLPRSILLLPADLTRAQPPVATHVDIYAAPHRVVAGAGAAAFGEEACSGDGGLTGPDRSGSAASSASLTHSGGGDSGAQRASAGGLQPSPGGAYLDPYLSPYPSLVLPCWHLRCIPHHSGCGRTAVSQQQPSCHSPGLRVASSLCFADS